MTLPVRSQDESVTKLDRGARVRRGRAHLAPRALRRLATVLTAVPEFAAVRRAPSATRAAAASHGTNGGDVKALTPSWSSCFSYSSDSATTATTVFRTTMAALWDFCPNIIFDKSQV